MECIYPHLSYRPSEFNRVPEKDFAKSFFGKRSNRLKAKRSFFKVRLLQRRVATRSVILNNVIPSGVNEMSGVECIYLLIIWTKIHSVRELRSLTRNDVVKAKDTLDARDISRLLRYDIITVFVKPPMSLRSPSVSEGLWQSNRISNYFVKIATPLIFIRGSQ